MRTTDLERQPIPHSNTTWISVWGALTLTCILALIIARPDETLRLVFSVVTGATSLASIFGFVKAGGHRINGLSLFNLAFLGLSGISGFTMLSDDQGATLWNVSAACLLGICLSITNVVCGSNTSASKEVVLPRSTAATLGASGFVLLATLVVVNRNATFDVLIEGGAFAASLTIVTSVLLREGARLFSIPSLFAVVSVLIYASEFHGGTGRLRLVGLLGACAVVLSLKAMPRVKLWVLASTPLVLWFLARQRLNLQESLQAGASSGNSGLESLVAPLHVLSSVMKDVPSTFDYSYGATLLSPIFTVLPSSLHPTWAAEPIGYELVKVVAPGRYGSGFSTAATVYGEGYWNAGWVGAILIAAALGIVLKKLDSVTLKLLNHPTGAYIAATGSLFALALTGSVMDLAWSGFHTWIIRTLTRGVAILILTLPLLMVAGLGVRRTAKRMSSGPQPRHSFAAPSEPPSKRSLTILTATALATIATLFASFFSFTSTPGEPGAESAWPTSATLPPTASTASPTDALPIDGAALVDKGKFSGSISSFRPEIDFIKSDIPTIYSGNCHVDQKSSSPTACLIHEAGPNSPTVALVGDSHAAQWSDALRIVAQRNGWNAISFTKSACGINIAPSTQPGGSGPYRSCTKWNKALPKAVKDRNVDLILTSNSSYNSSFDAGGRKLTGLAGLDAAVAGHREARQRLSRVASTVEILDLPTPGDQTACLRDGRARKCSVSEDRAREGRNQVQRLALSSLPEIPQLDFSRFVCQNDRCPAVVNGVVTFRDSNHLTASYSQTMARPLEEALRDKTQRTLWGSRSRSSSTAPQTGG